MAMRTFAVVLVAFWLAACGTTEGVKQDAASAWNSAKNMISGDANAPQSQDYAQVKRNDGVVQQTAAPAQRQTVAEACSAGSKAAREGARMVSKALVGFVTTMLVGPGPSTPAPMPGQERVIEDLRCQQLQQVAAQCRADADYCNQRLRAEAQRDLKNFRQICAFADFADTETCMASDEEVIVPTSTPAS